MQPFDTDKNDERTSGANSIVEICTTEELIPGSSARVKLPNGDEAAICNVDGEYYAIDNSCPHQGAPLSEGVLCGHVVECFLHGWQFDLRTGECLTVPEKLRTYEVREEQGVIRIVCNQS